MPPYTPLGRSLRLALALVCVLCAGCRTQQPPRVAASAPAATRLATVLTTDCGVDMDDQWALTHLLLSAEIDLRAIVTTHASSVGFSSAASAKEATDVVARVLPASSPRPPIVAGHGSRLLAAAAPPSNAGADLLLELSRGFSPSRRLVVFVIGAATDVASALLKDRSVADRIAIVAMGFQDWPEGGDEFNIRNDPVAWQVILDSDAPVVVGSAAATKRGLRLTRTDAAALMRGHGPLGEYLYSLFDEWLTKEAEVVARMVAPETWVVWDEVVVAYALGMARGDEVPRPRLQPDMLFAHPPTERRITWVTQIDTDRVWQDFTRKIDLRDLSRR